MGETTNQLLQLLLTRYRLERLGQSGGVRLQIEFGRDAPAIHNNRAKSGIQKRIPSFKRRAAYYQNQLNEFLLKGIGDAFEFDDPSFPFRYASGGTLPIITIDRRKYYCLYYREIYPVGWNIVNGATDTMDELANPSHAAKRELSEELIMVHPGKQIFYAFDWDSGKLIDRPGFAAASGVFRKQYPALNLAACREVRAKLKWSPGPDSLRVKYDNNEPRLIGDCFVNINAIDFGIEIDKIAHISIDKNTILFDGEINDRVSVGAPIGLFPVTEMNKLIQKKQHTIFRPRKFFYEAGSYDAETARIETIIRSSYLPRLRKEKVISKQELDSWYKVNEAGCAFDLCPVTRSLIFRYVVHQKARHKKKTRKSNS